jgi:acetylornithine deacetylase/succinyl-diaminopimelate desuccinylase-like protein
LIGEIAGGGDYAHLLPDTVTIEVFGVTCRCLSLDALIRVKRAAGRPPRSTPTTSVWPITWSVDVDPFGGVIKDGYIYGRGAVDDKDTVAAGLVAILLIHRHKIPLDRDVIFLAESGEEGTTRVGIDFVIEHHWDKIAAEFALAEGGSTPTRDGMVRYIGVATTEKVPRGIRLIARGTSGHGSAPRPDNPIVRLAAAVAKLGQYQPPMRLNETTRTFFKRLTAISPPDEAFLYAHLEDPDVGPLVQEKLRTSNVGFNSMLRTSISPNIITGGFRSNVIPAQAEATLDVRALPDEDMDRFIAELARLIDDPAIDIVREPRGRPAGPPSPLDNELFQTIERVQRAMYPEAVTIPLMLAAATDMAQLRAKGIPAYGLGSPAEEDERRAHGNDERIAIDALGQFVEFVFRAIVAVAQRGS